MRRKKAPTLRREIDRAAAQAVAGAAAQSAPPGDPSGQALAGADDGSGTWQPYGRIGITPIGQFRIAD